MTTKEIVELRDFKLTMDKLLPDGEIPSLGSKYIQVAMNFFRNDYLREVLMKRPEYNAILRAYIGDEDARTEKILAMPPDLLRAEEHDLDAIFSKQVQA